MNNDERKLWQTAAELFAMSILEVCPKIVFKAIRSGHLGFFCDFIAPEPIQKDHIDHAIARMKQRKKVDIVEMVSTNVVDYMKYQKQPLRASIVDLQNQFTKVIKIDDVYGDVLEGDATTDLSLLKAVELGMPALVGEEVFRKKRTPLYRIEGFAFASTMRLKEHKRVLKENAPYDHRKVPFQGEIIQLWRSIYETFANVLSREYFEEVWRGEELFKKQFCEVDEAIDDQDEFGLKANGRFRGIKFSLSSDDQSLKTKLHNALPIKSDIDIYGLKWPLIEFDKVGKIWIDRIVALKIEEKCVSKKGCFSKVVT